MKKLSTAIIFTLMALFTTTFTSTAHAWPEVDHMNMCGSAAQVIRSYKGNPQAWQNRDLYTQSRKATLYFQANCPETTAGKTEQAVAHTATAPQQQPKARPASCKDCFNAGYRKGLKDGRASAMKQGPAASSVTTPPSYRKVPAFAASPMINHGDHMHHTEAQRADCARTDALNRAAGPVIRVIKTH